MEANKPHVMFHAGVGGVGKTSVVSKVLEMAPVFGRRVTSMPSITRSVYAKLGITGEKVATEMTPEAQFRLQYAIQDAYYNGVEEFIAKSTEDGVDLVLIDRSPMDHVSYLLHNMAFHMTLADVNDNLDHAWGWLAKLAEECSVMSILYYGYPEPWHFAKPEEESSDGFRFDAGGKNYMWNCILESLLRKTPIQVAERHRYLPLATLNLKNLVFPQQGMSVEERARFVLDSAKP